MLVDADHGYGNALNVRRTVQELETSGAAGLTIEDTLLPQEYGQKKTQLISLEEGVGKMKAAARRPGRPTLVIVGRTGAARSPRSATRSSGRGPMRQPGWMGCSSPASKSGASWRRSPAATPLPIVLGGAPEEMSDLDYLTEQRVRIALQGHAPIGAATQAVYETLKALRDGLPPKDLKRLASSERTNKVMREADVKARITEFLGLKR